VIDALRAKRGVVIGRIANDLATPLVACVRGKSILEDCDVIVGLGDLGLFFSGARGTQRAVVGGRVVGAILPPRSDGDPLFEKGMPAKLAQTFS
jgi:hypothetical protein